MPRHPAQGWAPHVPQVHWSTLLLALALVALDARAAHAFDVHNQTSLSIDVGNHPPGTYRASVAPGTQGACAWGEAACNPTQEQSARVPVWVISAQANFSCEVRLQASGWLVVKEVSRAALGLPPAISCQAFDADGTVFDTDPLGDHTGTRSVRFLATADPQFWWEDSSPALVARTEARNLIALATTRRMLRELRSSCSTLGCAVRGITISGDLTNYSRLNEYRWFVQSTHPYERYVYAGMGNHDQVLDYFKVEGINLPHPPAHLGQLVKCLGMPERCADITFIRDQLGRDSRRSTRPTNLGEPHYSWDWDDVHFVQLNVVPLSEPSITMPDLDPYQALQFLERDLARYVGISGRPVVLFHHYGFDDVSANPKAGTWWTDEQRAAYWHVIAQYNVIAIFTGHLHLERQQDPYVVWRRPAGSTEGPDSIATFVAGGALNGAYVDVQIDSSSFTVRRMGLNNPQDSTSALTEHVTRVVPIPRRQGARACRPGVLQSLGNDYVVATFSVPEAPHEYVITWIDGGAWVYRNGRCYNVWWTGQAGRCNDGTWQMSPKRDQGRNANCHGEGNTVQPYLHVTRR